MRLHFGAYCLTAAICNRNVAVGLTYHGVMAWDTEGTRRRLKEAATAEFAEHGPAGTTMAAIAERAGINKERLYKYFGDKQALFELVLSDELAKLAASVTPAAGGLEDIGEFAGRTFDYHTAHPELPRLRPVGTPFGRCARRASQARRRGHLHRSHGHLRGLHGAV